MQEPLVHGYCIPLRIPIFLTAPSLHLQYVKAVFGCHLSLPCHDGFINLWQPLKGKNCLHPPYFQRSPEYYLSFCSESLKTPNYESVQDAFLETAFLVSDQFSKNTGRFTCSSNKMVARRPCGWIWDSWWQSYYPILWMSVDLAAFHESEPSELFVSYGTI